MKNSLIIIFITLFSSGIFAQNKYTVSGYVKDKANGESSLGATVYIKELLKGTTTSASGFYSITIEEGEYTLAFSYIGYKTFEKKIVLDKNIRFNYEIELDVI
ncbi:MAG: carboxypeptidase-like regulatory domain-containing protein, partial [Vicingaceae bacterium]